MFQAAIGVRGSYPSKSHVPKDSQDGQLIMALGNGPKQLGLSLLHDIDSSTGGFCAILSREMVAAQERSLSFTYGRPAESWTSLGQMYFGKRRIIIRNCYRIIL